MSDTPVSLNARDHSSRPSALLVVLFELLNCGQGARPAKVAALDVTAGRNAAADTAIVGSGEEVAGGGGLFSRKSFGLVKL